MLFRFAQIGEHHPGRTAQIGREESEAGHHVVDAVRTERNADTRHVRHSEDARQVVVASAAADRADGEIEGLDLEDPGNEPQYDKPGFLELGVSPKTAPDKSEFVELEFEKGVPVSLNGEKLKPAVLIAKLNEIGGRNGIGLYDVVENRLVGMKSRGVYETPGGTILYKAHEVLETLTLDKLTAHKKRELAITFGELVYDGQWFSPLRKALSAFVTSTQEHVTGKVRLELYKGNLINAGVWSPYSLYREDIATFAAGGDYKQSDATGFISIYGLPTKVQAIVNNEKEGK